MWKVPNMWEGGECWIIGGGPSMPRQFGVPEDVIAKVLSKELPVSAYSPFLSHIHDQHTIGINAAFLLGDWIDIVFFGDGQFYFSNRRALDARLKLKVCCHKDLIKKHAKGIRFMSQDRFKQFGISEKNGQVVWNLNSGVAAISLAYQLGVKRVYLLGFDMTLDEDDRQHWHSHYSADPINTKRKKEGLPFGRHLMCFDAVKRDADRLGLEIINVSPESKIKQFERVALKDIIDAV
jgi:hypothetical protein